MKQSDYLKRFEYSIHASKKNINDSGNLHADFSEMLSQPLKVSIDFAHKRLFLVCNRIQTKSLSSKTALTGFDFEKERINVYASIYCGLDINLSGSSNEELVFLLEGSMDIGKSKNHCSGLIVIENKTGRNDGGKEWVLRICLYDSNNAEREIKLELMMFSFLTNAAFN